MANDFFNVPDNAISNQVFYAKGATDFQIWSKPQNCKFVNIFCLGSGAGGGGGTAGTATTARKGGGGGGSGAYSLGFFSASQLPDTLFIQTAIGGEGGAGSTNGGSGALSYVSVQPNTTSINVLMQSGAVAATFGQGSGNGGTGSTAWTGNILNNLGLVTATAGVNGASGAISFPGADITITTIVSGGASGGNTSTAASFVGGSILGAGFINTISGGAAGSGATTGGWGSDGYIANLIGNSSNRQPMFFTGGAGGGASVSGRGGNGGAGAYGSGGGGGGAGFTALSGAGGRGGDGLIIITCF